MAEHGTEGLTALWPTLFLRRTLPGAEVANQALAALILELDEAKTDLTTDYLGGNFLLLDHRPRPGCATASTARSPAISPSSA